MSTSPISFRRRARRAALALIVSTILVPASSAPAQGDTTYHFPAGSGDRPEDYPGMPGNPQTPPPAASLVSASSAPAQDDTTYHLPAGSGDRPEDYPGMPGSPQTPPPVASHAPEASGFDWTSAAIGAGAAGVLIVVSLGAATAASRLRSRTVRS
jgi:hypothetical protein